MLVLVARVDISYFTPILDIIFMQINRYTALIL